ncbi:hypothetical protein F2P81_015591 [Scophthalmus maximus]|uniref:Uncharacterized protein n=1 Tax=Scophthalmus maximus TaxID=52904 RepID=A0A6A4SQL7_SCOMX|nr:hypothetical protein F2P81_015591 [Scophthalmus maximus]
MEVWVLTGCNLNAPLRENVKVNARRLLTVKHASPRIMLCGRGGLPPDLRLMLHGDAAAAALKASLSHCGECLFFNRVRESHICM